jgi:hypothetical protein
MIFDMKYNLQHGEPKSKHDVGSPLETMPDWPVSSSRSVPRRAYMMPNPSRDSSLIASTNDTIRSCSIPLPSSHVHRTASELQLSLDELVAEEKEATMFYRLVNGTRERLLTNDSQYLSSSVSPVGHAKLAHCVTASKPAADEWSISGFDTIPPDSTVCYNAYNANAVSAQEEDDVIFTMDL